MQRQFTLWRALDSFESFSRVWGIGWVPSCRGSIIIIFSVFVVGGLAHRLVALVVPYYGLLVCGVSVTALAHRVVMVVCRYCND